VPPHCIPIHANVTTFDWAQLSAVASFDVVMMDPPWQLATANPTRGVALGYSQLTGERWRGVIEAAGGGGRSQCTFPYSTVQCSSWGQGPSLASASEPRADEGAQRAYLRTPVSQVRCEGGGVGSGGLLAALELHGSVQLASDVGQMR
jgi:hypothetical protein